MCCMLLGCCLLPLLNPCWWIQQSGLHSCSRWLYSSMKPHLVIPIKAYDCCAFPLNACDTYAFTVHVTPMHSQCMWHLWIHKEGINKGIILVGRCEKLSYEFAKLAQNSSQERTSHRNLCLNIDCEAGSCFVWLQMFACGFCPRKFDMWMTAVMRSNMATEYSAPLLAVTMRWQRSGGVTCGGMRFDTIYLLQTQFGM